MSQPEAGIKPDVHEVEPDSIAEPPSEVIEQSSPAIQNKTDDKIEIYLKATGDAPIMKKKKWFVPKTRTVCEVAEFVRKYLKLDRSENLFLFVNQAFAPAPDQNCGNLHQCYGTIGADGLPGALVLYYSKVQAWG